MARDYNAAVAALNTLQSNFAIRDAIRKAQQSGQNPNAQAIPEMIEWCRRIGYEPSGFDQLNLIHIAGTKGKGSTSAFISSILAQYLPMAPDALSPSIRKVGLFTSPHLRFVRERIQFNNEPIGEELFAKYFFDIWDRLEAANQESPMEDGEPTKPMYFRYLTLMALHAYLEEGVNTAVIECGIGGEYDSTNILVQPSVTAITSLGIDHTPILGPTIEDIAWHKAGIMKPSAVTFSSPQPDAAMNVLRSRATEKGVSLHVVECHPELQHIKLGLEGDFQRINASVAIAVAAMHLRNLGFLSIPDPTKGGSFSLPAEFRHGLEQVKLGGRCEIRREHGVTWHIDGGHTLESIRLAAQWFAGRLNDKKSQKRVLIFNQQGTDRTADPLARALHAELHSALKSNTATVSSIDSPFTHAIFCSNTTFKSGYKPDLVNTGSDKAAIDALSLQKALAQTWNEIDPLATVKVVRTIEEAIEEVRNVKIEEEEKVMALITGSLHLVGGAIDVLETQSTQNSETRNR